MRILAMTAESDLWSIWIDGHEAVLKLLDAGDTRAALSRYRTIYAEFRGRVERELFDDQ
jgi:hypothetical protein